MTAQAPVDDAALALGQARMSPTVQIGGAPLASDAAQVLIRVVVDSHVALPDTFELSFLDTNLDVVTRAGLRLGSPVQVAAGVRGGSGSNVLIDGEVTGIHGVYGESAPITVVRGSALDHRLQRVRRTRTFVNIRDSDIARELAREAGIRVGTVDPTAQIHPQLAQDNLTDWQFLRARAEEIGFEVGVTDNQFYFRRAGSIDGAVPLPVSVGTDLVSFEPRISAWGLVPEVEVRVWDPVNAQAKAVRKPVSSPVVSIGAGTAADAADSFGAGAPVGRPGGGAGTSDLGPMPSPQAHVIWDRALTIDNGNTQALEDTADSMAERLGSGFAEADGELLGDSRVTAGSVLEVAGVPDAFAGKWTVTRALHVFDHSAGFGYRTRFTVSGRQDRSMLSMTSTGDGAGQGPARISGVVAGVVSAIDDPLGLGRVTVALPWLSPDYVTGWAAVTQLTAGKSTGTMFLPEPGDQVLVAFEFGDVRRPYVLGSVVNKRTGAGGNLVPAGSSPPGRSAVKPGRPASVIRRGFVSPSGNRLLFHDDGPPGGGRPTASQVVLATDGDKVGLRLDQVAGTLVLGCTPGTPRGRLTIECDGDIEIKAGPTGRLTIDGGAALTLKGKTVAIEGTGPTSVKGKPIQLN